MFIFLGLLGLNRTKTNIQIYYIWCYTNLVFFSKITKPSKFLNSMAMLGEICDFDYVVIYC